MYMMYCLPLQVNSFCLCVTCLHVRHRGFLHWYIPLRLKNVREALTVDPDVFVFILLGATLGLMFLAVL